MLRNKNIHIFLCLLFFSISANIFAETKWKQEPNVIWGCKLKLNMKAYKKLIIPDSNFEMKGRGSIHCNKFFLNSTSENYSFQKKQNTQLTNNLQTQAKASRWIHIQSQDSIKIPVIASWKKLSTKRFLSSRTLTAKVESLQISLVKDIEKIFTRYNLTYQAKNSKKNKILLIAQSKTSNIQFYLSILTSRHNLFFSKSHELEIKKIE